MRRFQQTGTLQATAGDPSLGAHAGASPVEAVPQALKGRGALSNPQSRFHQQRISAFDDGWCDEAPAIPKLQTTVRDAKAKSILAKNQSPDVPFDQSINPYNGCEHGCIYCFARPSHAYHDLSPGLDFETQLFYKPNAAQLLRDALSKPGYTATPIGLGTNTDPYQPIEKRFRITRSVLEVLLEARHPITIVTKGTMIVRDLDLLQQFARRNLVHVMMSVPTLDRSLKRTLEPRTADPNQRLKVIHTLREAGVPTGVLVAPIIPVVTDREIEAICRAAASAGADRAAYVLLRLPHEVKPLFEQWLATHMPYKAKHVMSLMHQLHNGKAYDHSVGLRQTGSGVFANLISMRFARACQRAGLDTGGRARLDCSQFRPPTGQGCLF